MDMMELIRTRKSVRTFDGNPISEADLQKLSAYIKTVTNPFGIRTDFVLLDAKSHGLSSPVIQGEELYIAGKVQKQPNCEAAFGYAFEQIVLYAWSLGIGTTWIGGTMKREVFEREAQVKADEIMPCVSPLGYPAKKRSVKEVAMRLGIKADQRKPDSSLFFDGSFSAPLLSADPAEQTALEAVRLAPSAVNKQPWRIVRCGNAYHFYEERTLSKADAPWDVQKVDLGIALCHFAAVSGGTLSVDAPKLAAPPHTEYIATITRNQ